MSLFGKNYERSGSGVAKNAPKKKGFFRFMEIASGKFWKLIELNLLYFLFFLPLLGAIAFWFVGSSAAFIGIAVCALLFFAVIGPATAAHTKILKNFVLEKPTFLVHDFFRTFRSEYRHAFGIGFLDCLIACSIGAACYVYPQLIEQTGSKLYYILFAVTLSVGLVVVLMNFYLFLMMISTNLSLKHVVKNAFALSVIALKTNVITLLIVGVVVAIFALVIAFASLRVAMVIMFLIPFVPASWLGLVVVFQCYPIIQKYIINPYYEQRGEINPELLQSAPEEESLFEDMGGKEKSIEAGKYSGSKKAGGSGRVKPRKGKIIS